MLVLPSFEPSAFVCELGFSSGCLERIISINCPSIPFSDDSIFSLLCSRDANWATVSFLSPSTVVLSCSSRDVFNCCSSASIRSSKASTLRAAITRFPLVPNPHTSEVLCGIISYCLLNWNQSQAALRHG